MTQKKAPVIKLRNRQLKKSLRNKIHLNTLELNHAVNHCDVKSGVCVTNLNAKEKNLFRKQPRYKKQV